MEHPMGPYLTRPAQVVHVIDGDSFDVIIDMGLDVHIKQRIRLARVNTPELRSPIPDERALAQSAFLFVVHAIESADHITIMTFQERDPWGRLIADLQVDYQDLASLIIENGLGVDDDGGDRAGRLEAMRRLVAAQAPNAPPFKAPTPDP